MSFTLSFGELFHIFSSPEGGGGDVLCCPDVPCTPRLHTVKYYYQLFKQKVINRPVVPFVKIYLEEYVTFGFHLRLKIHFQ